MVALALNVEEHIEKLRKGDRANSESHFRREIENWIGLIEKGLDHVGKKTGREWSEKIRQWRSQIEK